AVRGAVRDRCRGLPARHVRGGRPAAPRVACRTSLRPLMSTPAPTIPPYVFEQQGTFDAPYEYTIPASLEIRPDTATATFDGTNAGGAFLACLTFYSPAGSKLCRMFNPTPVNAGDVAEVTYIPPFGAAASGSTSGGVTEIDSITLDITDPTGPVVEIDIPPYQ